ncbi:hypothetical protein KIH39_10575 [Telmatocola sphagniphila]|uniref:GerMN domain-containing protein n=1 Tax=Telmatocola sphagniphila TaxID=1123043 RepID=A0A8E6EV06_9BACT|nr:hypothetical protein [Telmatocola sphagniphila]QVL34324.1 hypothetical protein KIH39_10575 [Telmatocola sphagniphila]
MNTCLKIPGLLLLCALGISTLGCSEDPGIRHYKEPRVAGDTKKAEAPGKAFVPEAGSLIRYLNAIVPTPDGRSYFVKLMGPPEDLAKIEPAFTKFIQSLKFPKEAGKSLTWEAPENWTTGPENQMRIATLRIPSGEKKLELTITLFGGDLKANIDRWRMELGLPELGAIGDAEYQKTVKEMTVDGSKVYIVDMQGIKKPGGMAPPFMKQ